MELEMPESKMTKKDGLEMGVSLYGLVLGLNSAVICGIFAHMASFGGVSESFSTWWSVTFGISVPFHIMLTLGFHYKKRAMVILWLILTMFGIVGSIVAALFQLGFGFMMLNKLDADLEKLRMFVGTSLTTGDEKEAAKSALINNLLLICVSAINFTYNWCLVKALYVKMDQAQNNDSISYQQLKI